MKLAIYRLRNHSSRIFIQLTFGQNFLSHTNEMNNGRRILLQIIRNFMQTPLLFTHTHPPRIFVFVVLFNVSTSRISSGAFFLFFVFAFQIMWSLLSFFLSPFFSCIKNIICWWSGRRQWWLWEIFTLRCCLFARVFFLFISTERQKMFPLYSSEFIWIIFF